VKKHIGTLIIKLGGWSENYPGDCNIDKCVIICAPYTSFWDYIYTIASFWKNDFKIKVLYEQKSRLGIRNFFGEICGGINLSKLEKEVPRHFSELLNSSEKMMLLVPTEGSRKKVDKWKTEFYDIAQYANVPIVLGYLDYEDKMVGIGGVLHASGNFDNDMSKIENFYKNFMAKHPHRYNDKIC